MQRITLCLPRGIFHRLDELVRAGYYPSRAEAIRLAIRDLLLSEIHLAEEVKHT